MPAIKLSLTAILFLAIPAVVQGQPVLSCPAAISVRESATPVPGWTSEARQTSRKLAGISIFNKDTAGEYQLAPDDEKQAGKATTQTWKLKDYRSMKLFLACSYHDTSITLSAEIPAALTTCTYRFTLAGKEQAVEHPEISCR